MIAGVFLDAGLAVLVLAVAGWTIAARAAFAAVVGFVTFGLLLSLIWVRLAAADVALTEAAIGSGVTGALLLGAAARLRPTEAAVSAEWPRPALRRAAAVFCAAVSAELAALVLFASSPAPTLARAAAAALPELGLGNAVTGVLLAYRAIDTLLEKVVLLLAVLGVWSLAPDRFWGGLPGPEQSARPDDALRFLGQLLPPFGIIVGIHILWVGATAPGGAFQSATILAAMWILVMLAGLKEVPGTGRLWLRLVLIGGPAIFAAVGLAGIVSAGSFLAYPPGFEKALIVAVEVALTVSIAAILALLAAGPPARTPQP